MSLNGQNPPPSAPPAESQIDIPITVGHMNTMMTQMLNALGQQQREAVKEMVQAAVQVAVNQRLPQHQPSSYAPETRPASSTSSSSSSSSSAAGVALNLPKSVKVSAPSTYNGSRSINLETWFFEMYQYFNLCGVNDEQQRIALASSYLKEAALQWWVNLCRSPLSVPQTWVAFTTAVRERFQPIAASRTARAQLRALSQGTLSVADYSTRFYSLIQLIPDMSDADQVEQFIYGLRRGLAREVDMREPTNLHSAMTAAQKVELLLDTHRSNYTNSHSALPYRSFPSSTSTFPSSYAFPSSSSSSTSSSSSGAPMELGNLNSTSQQEQSDEEKVDLDTEYQRCIEEGEDYVPFYADQNDNQVDDHEAETPNTTEQLQAMRPQFNRRFLPPNLEEFKRCMQLRLCLRCKKPNHIARNCPQPPAQSSFNHKPIRNFH